MQRRRERRGPGGAHGLGNESWLKAWPWNTCAASIANTAQHSGGRPSAAARGRGRNRLRGPTPSCATCRAASGSCCRRRRNVSISVAGNGSGCPGCQEPTPSSHRLFSDSSTNAGLPPTCACSAAASASRSSVATLSRGSARAGRADRPRPAPPDRSARCAGCRQLREQRAAVVRQLGVAQRQQRHRQGRCVAPSSPPPTRRGYAQRGDARVVGELQVVERQHAQALLRAGLQRPRRGAEHAAMLQRTAPRLRRRRRRAAAPAGRAGCRRRAMAQSASAPGQQARERSTGLHAVAGACSDARAPVRAPAARGRRAGSCRCRRAGDHHRVAQLQAALDFLASTSSRRSAAGGRRPGVLFCRPASAACGAPPAGSP